MKIIRRVRPQLFQSVPEDGSLYICDYRSFDIPETVVAMIRNAAPGLVAVTVRLRGGNRMVKLVERAARKRNIRIIWL